MKLSGYDRLMIVQRILPEKGGLLQQIVVREIREMLSLRSDEFDKYGLREENGLLFWNEKIQSEEDYNLTSQHIEVLKQGVKALDRAEEIDDTILNVVLKINNI